MIVEKGEVINMMDNIRFEIKLKMDGELKKDFCNYNLMINKDILNYLNIGLKWIIFNE